MQKHNQIEASVKSVLNEKVRDIMPPDYMFDRIKANIEADRSKIMLIKVKSLRSNFSIKKIIAASLCCMVLLASSVFAADYFSKYVRGFATEKEYASPPSKSEIKKDTGFEAKIPKVLPGNFNLEHSNLAGYINGSSISQKYDKKKVVSGTYKKSDSTPNSFVTLSASNDESETHVGKNARTIYINGSAAYYWEYKLHIVPYGKKLSDEETAQEKAGNSVTVYVSSKKGYSVNTVERFETIKSLKWKDNSINYVLADNGCGLSQDELLKIAESIINTK